MSLISSDVAVLITRLPLCKVPLGGAAKLNVGRYVIG
jgi:hypothetical protein